MRQAERVAIVGMGGVFPGAEDLAGFWRNVAGAVDSSRAVPAGRWTIPPKRAYDSRLAVPDRVCSIRGYFLDPFQPDLTGLDVDPELVRELDVLFHLALHAGGQAFRSARMGAVERSRVGVILGSIALPTERISELAHELIASLATPQATTQPLNQHVTGLPAILLAKALGLGGTAFTLDAACASSLYAVKLAVDELLSHRADAMLAGGLSRPDCLYTQMGFSQLRALSPTGRCSPFDAAADGLVVGEGAGIFVLKRLSDALVHGDCIHGVIAGIGLSNDIDGNVLAPASEGQLRAMRAAYRSAGWRPDDIDLIECHATGTPVGDLVEFQSLMELWKETSPGRECIIGSVKSNVGHLLTGANAAGLHKVLLAMRQETLPPSANFAEPARGMPIDESPFRILSKAQEWRRRDDVAPRRAAVSGFGFGGINAHLLIEEWLDDGERGCVSAPSFPQPIAIVSASAHFGHRKDLNEFAEILVSRDAESSKRSAGPASAPALRFEDSASRLTKTRIDALEISVGAFPLPPKEMEEMLPQQLLMLRVAREALHDGAATGAERTGVFVGLDLDWNTTNFHLRWWLSEQALPADSQAQQEALDAASPPLNANRTLGALASVAASRVARSFRFGGPSFTVSSAATSGLHALEIAAGLLRRGEIDRALVGAVDLTADVRSAALSNGTIAGDGAAALVLKRLEDAVRDGDPILAVLGDDTGNPLYVDGERQTFAVEPIETRIGQCGAAEGFASVVRACLALDRRLLPARGRAEPQYWLHDSANGLRTAKIIVESLLGYSRTTVLVSRDAESSERSAERFDVSALRSEELPGAPGLTKTGLFLFAAGSMSELRTQMQQLSAIVSNGSIANLAREWWLRTAATHHGPLRLALLADSISELHASLAATIASPETAFSNKPSPGARVLAGTIDPAQRGQIAFVFPGSGNQYPDMGRELGLLFPEILDRQQRENRFLRGQYATDEFWSGRPVDDAHPRTILFAQVSCGTFVADLLRSFGVEPDAAIGYSLGESASLFGLRVWRDRDEMMRRLRESNLFASDLAPPYNSARAQWGWSADRPIDWATGVLAVSADVAAAAIQPGEKAYVLIVNTTDECVIGGHRPDVEAVVNRIGRPFVDVRGVTTAHCDVALPVRDPYRALHHLPVTPSAVRFYSGAAGHAYEATADAAADAILGAVLRQIDFPRVVEAAYCDGVRAFIEIGPGASCTRMIGKILSGRPHRAVAVQVRNQDALATLLSALAELHAFGAELDLAPLYGRTRVVAAAAPSRVLRIPVRAHVPRILVSRDAESLERSAAASNRSALRSEDSASRLTKSASRLNENDLVSFADVAHGYIAVAEAHEAFLRFSTNTQERMAETIALQTQLLSRSRLGDLSALPESASGEIPRALSFEQCQEFAAGSIARVLGPTFAEADSFSTRVRLPDGPLMLVDRILEIHGEPRSMTSGRVTTEHQVHADRWYLDAGRMPTCVAVEAGQADLFLSGFLGIDFVTRGLAVYRLLDAAITFHGPLPRIGDLVRYDIHIDGFFRQGDTHLFRFRFESTVGGRPLLTMTDGCAGFFSAEELASGKGIVQTELDRRTQPGKRPDDWRPLVPMQGETIASSQINALRAGDLVGAFGETFAGLPLRLPLRLPGGMLRLVDRVVQLDPEGGRFGLGLIRAEADIHPDDWFLTCHFVDDMVMPGTLMYECCLHTLRIFLMRLGWIGEEGEVVCEPLPGVSSRLKCRGQVIASTKTAAYEVVIKEIGYGPEPYAIADALMYADGRPIVEISNMSLRFSGLNREKVERCWRSRGSFRFEAISEPSSPNPLTPALSPEAGDREQTSYPLSPGFAGERAGVRGERLVDTFDRDRILAFAVGKPSEAFGAPYRIFDEERIIARLPGPPYQFLDRITRIEAEPWRMVAGGVIDVEYDVPAEEWYFVAHRSPRMPFAVLLEVALQPCGWLAAYVGSALTSPIDLSFRNLGGSAVQHLPVGPDIGTLTTTVILTRVSNSAGMIIQHYDFAVRSRGRDVYTGDTYFGFFTKQALANQVGLRECTLYQPDAGELARAWQGEYPREAPFPDAMMRMVDRITWYVPDGGPHGLGAIEGRIAVDPRAWFFQAHFYQDPVWPGSLGLESFVQLLQFAAADRWEMSPIELMSPVAGAAHRWTYRGQVLPVDSEVTVQAYIKNMDDNRHLLTADGLLSVDGRVIYQMTDFTVARRNAPRAQG